MRANAAAFTASLGLLAAACATSSPLQEAQHALFWESAKECEERHRTIRVRFVDPDGKIYLYDYAQAERVLAKIEPGLPLSPGRLSSPPGGSTTTSVPLRMVAGITLVEAAVNDSGPATFLLDTGASRSVISQRLASDLRITVPKDAPRRMFAAAGGNVVWVPFVRVESLKVGSFAVEDLHVGVLALLPESSGVDGLLGNDFLGHFTVTVDPTSRVMTLTLPE